MEEQIVNASKRWIEEGKEIKSAINNWIDKIYIEKVQPEEDCPEETRSDMAEYVLEQLEVFNREGKQQEFRDLFPPDNDPLMDVLRQEYRWEQIRKVAYLSDGRILAKFGTYAQEQGVYLIDGESITLIDEIIGFGASLDKKYYAKVYLDKITLHEGWDGVETKAFSLPDGFSTSDLCFDSIEVFKNGKQVVLVTHYGVFLIDETGSKIIHGGLPEVSEKNSIEGPDRPSTVPVEANWNASENEWEIGENNAQGNPIGTWKWWLAPNGHLCCETIYHGEDGQAFSFTRFHPDGTPSRKGIYLNGQPVGRISWYRSENPTLEQYPNQKAGENVYETVQVVKGGYCVEEYYYDKEGNEVQEPYISNYEASELIQRMAVLNHMYQNKDWKNSVIEVNKTLEEGVAEDYKEDTMRLLYYKAFSLYQLNSQESNTEIEEILEELLNMHDFMIWSFLDEHLYLDDAIQFANSILEREEVKPGTTPDYKFLDYPHAAISPDDNYIAVGSQDSSHIVYSKKNEVFEQTASIYGRSEYPNIACFNYRHDVGPLLALGSCHFRQSGTLGVYVDQIEGLEASGWDLDSEALFVVDDQKWVFSMIESGMGFFLGCNDGYIWIKWGHSNSPLYIHIGSTIMSMDFSVDRNRLVVGTHAGQVIVLKFREDLPIAPEEGTTGRVNPYLITNLSVDDEKRYLFPKEGTPLSW